MQGFFFCYYSCKSRGMFTFLKSCERYFIPFGVFLTLQSQIKGRTQMIILHDYTLVKNNNCMVAVARNGEKQICPICHGNTKVRDTKIRKVKDNNAQICLFRLKRVVCCQCKTLHTVIPDCIIPYKHYYAEIIEGVQKNTNDCCGADNSTLYRWKNS